MAQVSYLTKNGVKRILESGRKQFADDSFIFQILEVKNFEGDQKKKSIKCRLKLSDGISIVTALVNNDAYEGIKHIDFKENSVINVSGFKVNQVKTKNVLILEKPFKLLGYCNVLGDPQNYEKLTPSEFTKSMNLSFKIQNENVNESNKKEEESKETGRDKKLVPEEKPQEPVQSKKFGSNNFVQILDNQGMNADYTPIAALNPMNPDWIVKARVTKKGAPRHWKNFRGEGDLMNIELKDEHGEQIQATFFNKHVEQFKDKIQENKIYSFQNGQIKQANSRYSSIKNPYCITFNSATVITPLAEDDNIETDGYWYTNLKEASKLENGKIIDIKGAVLNVEDMDEITMKSGISKPIRRILIADNSKDPGLSIQVTFWGKIAYKANLNKGDIIAIKDAKVGTYNAVSLNVSDECEIKKLKNDKVLTPWYESLQSINDIIPLSEQNKNKFKNKEAGLQPEFIVEIGDKVHEDIEELTTPNYVIEAYLTFIAKADNMVYMACPEDKKKMQKEFGSDQWLWERWNKYYDKPVPTYMVTAKVSDPTGAFFVSFYAEQAEQVFDGFSADEFSDIQIHGTENEVKDKINEFLYKPIRVMVKARQNDFGRDMGNIKYFGQKVYPYKYNAHNLNLINALKEYSKCM